jgi:hypothetical protein
MPEVAVAVAWLFLSTWPWGVFGSKRFLALARLRNVQPLDECLKLLYRFPSILLLCPPRRLSRLEAVVAVSHPHDAHCLRHLVPGHFLPIPKRIALTLHDQRIRLDRLQVLDPQLI